MQHYTNLSRLTEAASQRFSSGVSIRVGANCVSVKLDTAAVPGVRLDCTGTDYGPILIRRRRLCSDADAVPIKVERIQKQEQNTGQ